MPSSLNGHVHCGHEKDSDNSIKYISHVFGRKFLRPMYLWLNRSVLSLWFQPLVSGLERLSLAQTKVYESSLQVGLGFILVLK